MVGEGASKSSRLHGEQWLDSTTGEVELPESWPECSDKLEGSTRDTLEAESCKEKSTSVTTAVTLVKSDVA